MNISHKTLLRLAGIAGIFLLVIVMLSLLAPRLIDTKRLGEKIIAGVSEKTGGKAGFQKIGIAFFPRPRVTVHQAFISIPEKAEVTIDALSVYPELLPLISGTVRVARLKIESPDISITLPGKESPHPIAEIEKTIAGMLNTLASDAPGLVVLIKKGKARFVQNNKTMFTFRNLDARISLPSHALVLTAGAGSEFSKSITLRAHLRQQNMSLTDISLAIEARDIDVASARQVAYALSGDSPVIQDIFSYLKGGEIPSLSFRSGGQTIADVGKTENISIQGRLHKGTVFVSGPGMEFSRVKGECVIEKGVLKGKQIDAFYGSAVLQKGNLIVGLKGSDAPFHLDVHARMDIQEGSRFIDRFVKDKPFPLNSLKENRGMIEADIRLGESIDAFEQWSNRGSLLFKGTIRVIDGPVVLLDMSTGPGGLIIRSLQINDKKSQSFLSLTIQKEKIGIYFYGRLFRSTIEKLLTIPYLQEGSLQGNVRAQIDLENPDHFSADGDLSIDRIFIPWKEDLPIDIQDIHLGANKNRLRIESALLKIAGNSFSLKGTVQPSPQGIVADLDLKTGRLKWESIQGLIGTRETAQTPQRPDQKKGRSVTGKVRMIADTFLFGNLTVSPLHADIFLSPRDTTVAISRASVCGIATSGAVAVSSDVISMDMTGQASGQALKPSVACLTNQKSMITGTFDFHNRVTAKGKKEGFMQSLNGKFDFAAKDGRFYKAVTFAKILSIVNVTGIFQGSIAELFREGFPYQSLIINGDIKNGKIVLKTMKMDAPSMKLAGTGTIDLAEEKIDVKILVAPLKTVDSILGKIPIIREITGKSLISVPVRVKGDLNNPEVSHLPLADVGTGLLDIIKSAVTLPVRIIEPLIPDKKKD